MSLGLLLQEKELLSEQEQVFLKDLFTSCHKANLVLESTFTFIQYRTVQ